MGYKQNNNPFNRKISSPLRHNVVNSEGKSWKHSHNSRGVSGRFEGGKIIKGSEDFNKRRNRAVVDSDTDTKRMDSGKRATSKNYAKDYADQLARGYNMGAITGGQFLAEEYNPGKGKFELFKGGDLVDFSTRGANIGEGGMYNVTYGERGSLVAPETQVTSDEIYEMMVQGGGLVSIVDGKIVAGNPNNVRFSERGTTGSGKSTFANQYHSGLADDYVPEGYTIDERSNEPRRKLTVKELLEQRKQRSNSAINRVMSNSPLNQGHETDERSNQTFNLQEGYDYQDPVVTVTESEWMVDPNDPTRMIRTITTDETITGRRENLNPGGLGEGQAENWAQLKEDICSGKVKGDTSICDDVQNISNTVTEYKPIEPEIEEEITTTEIEETPPQDPVFEFDLGSGRKKKKQFDIELPDVNLPSLGLDELNILKKKCGGCRQRGLIQRAILALGGGI
jgi:hypothetical protein